MASRRGVEEDERCPPPRWPWSHGSASMAQSRWGHHALPGTSATLAMLHRAILVPGRVLSRSLVGKRDAWPGSSRGYRQYSVAEERAHAHKRRVNPRAMVSWGGDILAWAVSSGSIRKSVVWREGSREPLDGGLSPQDDKGLSRRQHAWDSIGFCPLTRGIEKMRNRGFSAE